jgi:hypothetical protein
MNYERGMYKSKAYDQHESRGTIMTERGGVVEMLRSPEVNRPRDEQIRSDLRASVTDISGESDLREGLIPASQAPVPSLTSGEKL